MESFALDPAFLQRISAFLQSDYFAADTPHMKSEYWQHYADAITIQVDQQTLNIQAQSGNYVPPHQAKWLRYLRKARQLLKQPSELFSRVQLRLQRPAIKLQDTAEAFDKVMQRDPLADIDLCAERLNFNAIRQTPLCYTSATEISHNYQQRTGRHPSHNVFMHYYYYNVLRHKQALATCRRIVEIGGGNGNFAEILVSHVANCQYILVDLPPVLCLAMAFLKHHFPDKTFVLAHEATPDTIQTADFVFLTPTQLELIPTHSVDLAINVHSFQEMVKAQIQEYFQWIDRITRPQGYFFTANRVEKVPTYSCAQLSKEAVIRFAEYPFTTRMQPVVKEVCRLARLTQLDNNYLYLATMK